MNTVIAIAQHKGGVGKTTSAVNIGAALARKGYSVLLVDLDPQGNLTHSVGLKHGEGPGIVEAFTSDEAPKPITVSGLDVMPSSLELAGIEIQLLNTVGREYALKGILQPLRKKYDYTLIDCPPSLGILTVNALTAADEVYIPLQAEFLAVKGLASLLDVIALIRKKLNKRLRIGGVIVTHYDSRKVLNKDTGATIAKHFKDEVFKTRIRDNVSLAEAPISGQDIFAYAPTSHGAVDYMNLTEEIIERHKN